MSNDFRFLMYQSAEENVSVNAVIKDETIWLSQKGMAELFDCSTDNISLHLKNIFSDGELTKDSVTEKISVTAADGKNYPTQFYNLDAIISVGYRVNSRRATQFRIWATSVLKEYMTKASRWMTNASNREQLRLVTTTSVSCLSVSARSAPANAASGNR